MNEEDADNSTQPCNDENGSNNSNQKDGGVVDELLKSFTSLSIPKTHATVGLSNLVSCNKQFRTLFINRRLPNNGWSNVQIQHFLYILSTLDTNNKRTVDCQSEKDAIDDDDFDNEVNSSTDVRWCGVGEREGRVYSSLVAQRHFGFGHGIGRSGDITEPQPKAVGSSVMAQLTLLLLLDAIRRGSGLDSKSAARFGLLLPLCTGMTMSLVLSAFRDICNTQQSSDNQRNIVLWSRIDQKSCFKAITSAGLRCVVVPTKMDGDQVVTNIEEMKKLFNQYKDSVLAVISTTSCFAPRVPDEVDSIAQLCQTWNVYHIVNNAYGLQCSMICKRINRACAIGRVDAIVSSLDKNFLVPVGKYIFEKNEEVSRCNTSTVVFNKTAEFSFLSDQFLFFIAGGAVVLSPKETTISSISKLYPGRASGSPMIDLFITLLSMGLLGYQKLLAKRTNMIDVFKKKFKAIAENYNEHFLICPTNTISFGMTLDNIPRKKFDNEDENMYIQSIQKHVSKFGAMLFTRCTSGTRVIPRGEIKKIGEQEFNGYGSSIDNYPYAYMTAACAIGLTYDEMNEFFTRVESMLKEIHKKKKKTEPRHCAE